MQQFRVVILDDENNVVCVEHESAMFDSDDERNTLFEKAKNDELYELNRKYNLSDWDNVPPMEYQRRVTDKNGDWGEWRYTGDPLDDWFNI